MAHELQKLVIAISRGQLRPGKLKHCTMVMLESSVAVVEQLNHQLIAVLCWWSVVHQRSRRCAHGFDILSQ